MRDDAATAEEIEAMTVGDEFSSPFEAAFARAELVERVKAAKEKYEKVVL